MQDHATALTVPELEDLRLTVRRCEKQWGVRTSPIDLIDGPLGGTRTVADRSLRDGASVGWAIRVSDRQAVAVVTYRRTVGRWIFGGILRPG